MMLDPVTGLDPPGSKVRAAEGIDAASSLIQGYWIWWGLTLRRTVFLSWLIVTWTRRSKIIENLAVVNYDTNNLYLAPYDWRLSYYNLEERDGYFSKLKVTIEGLKLAPPPPSLSSSWCLFDPGNDSGGKSSLLHILWDALYVTLYLPTARWTDNWIRFF